MTPLDYAREIHAAAEPSVARTAEVIERAMREALESCISAASAEQAKGDVNITIFRDGRIQVGDMTVVAASAKSGA